jgi:hypothetical protein
VRVERTDASYAYLTVLSRLPSSYAMPRAEYDSTFVHRFRPAGIDEVMKAEDALDDLPANAPAEWRPAPVEGAPLPPVAEAVEAAIAADPALADAPVAEIVDDGLADLRLRLGTPPHEDDSETLLPDRDSAG